MGVHKLDIEFEDDDEIQAREEAVRKRDEAVQDVDLDFEAAPSDVDAPVKKVAEKKTAPAPAPAEVTSPENKQKVITSPSIQAQNLAPANGRPEVVSIGSSYQLGDELRKVEATNSILTIEIEAKIQVAIANKLGIILAKKAQETKELEHKVGKLVAQLHKKAPELKKELMMIKKLLSDNSQIAGDTDYKTEPKATEQSTIPAKKVVKKAA